MHQPILRGRQRFVKGLVSCPNNRLLLAPFLVHLAGVEPLSVEEIGRTVTLALAEDIGTGDVTTLAAVPEAAQAKAVVCAREPLVVAGLALGAGAFREV